MIQETTHLHETYQKGVTCEKRKHPHSVRQWDTVRAGAGKGMDRAGSGDRSGW